MFKAVSTKMDVDHSTVARLLQKFKTEEVKAIIETGFDFGLRHARELLRLKDNPEAQLELAEE